MVEEYADEGRLANMVAVTKNGSRSQGSDEAEGKGSGDKEEEEARCVKEDVTMMDSRIEGMEEAMMEMNNMVQLMQKKVGNTRFFKTGSTCTLRPMRTDSGKVPIVKA